jgi:hypothetical protein
MRWKHEPKPKTGTQRVVRRFLLLPRRFDNETRWLEYANIREEYQLRYYETTLYSDWHEVGFAD